MIDRILLGRGRKITKIPRQVWEDELSQVPQKSKARLGFMSKTHHLVRKFVVQELPRTGRPIPPEMVSHSLNLPLARVNAILDELEANLFFLVRNRQGAISWAYPGTVEATPHKLLFNTGERLYGA